MAKAGSTIANKDEQRTMRRECFKAMKRIQEAAGFSVADWARRSELSQPGLVAYTSGGTVPSGDALARLCAGLGLPNSAAQNVPYLDRVADMARNRNSVLKMIDVLRERIERAASDLEGKVVGHPDQEERMLAELNRALKPAATQLNTILVDLAAPGPLDEDFPEASELQKTCDTLSQFLRDVRTLWNAIHRAGKTPGLTYTQRLAQAFSAVFLSHGHELQRVLNQTPVRATTLLAALAVFLQLDAPPGTPDTATFGKVDQK